MHIQLLSDLHLEENSAFQPQRAPGADVLVLAGDIGSYQGGSALSALGDEDFGLGRFADWPVPVIVVPGNHEYDTLDFDATHARLRATCERLGLIWLERETIVLHGVRFVGTTLWADFDALAPRGPTASLADQLQARHKAFRAADYYLRIAATTRGGAPFLAEQIREHALVCQAWLRAALAEPFDGPTVVVTHFAPSLRSADPRYGLRPGTAGFCNALDDLLPLADLWLHGHLHCAIDWRDDSGRCRVVANPLGYEKKGEQAAFAPQLAIALERAPAPPPMPDGPRDAAA
ncbi:metallophosphoesterase [Ottowia beijingensis]|uniref:Metallophosphoesterase n=1 Tax=Ottowia beijingensis TaxID=1207057 RepID=A0A853IX89_9BURK|nr:metallophosphoesterase [Ottowia beijingensis]NZA02100.1 metallophosphoesterase [Ottowia beijingensis]